MKKIKVEKERYNIIISSQSDASKRTLVFSITKRTFLISMVSVALALIVSISSIVFFNYKSAEYSLGIARTKYSIEEQTAFAEYYSKTALVSDENHSLSEAAYPAETLSSKDEKELSTVKTGLYDSTEQSVASNTSSEKILLFSEDMSGQLAPEYAVSIPMIEAIDTVNSEFQFWVDEQIVSAAAAEGYTDYQIIYDGDYEGDSYAVNNWADVLSVFVAKTMYEDQKLLTVPSDRIDLLKEIYIGMNEVSIIPTREMDIASGDANLVLYVSINSLTYSEGALLYDLDDRQQQKLNLMMSPDYYIYFSELLGVDVYDGMGDEGIRQIIDNLPDTKGAEVVKAALIRLGNPYSRAKRGSGSYVDCSYFTWWSYNQAGISIPTSSVEQAKYCFENGFAVEKDDLQPGDLIFWSKKGCRCGRWHEIHHAGIYIGDGKIIEAVSGKGCVIIRPIWGEDGKTWKIFMYARPS